MRKTLLLQLLAMFLAAPLGAQWYDRHVLKDIENYDSLPRFVSDKYASFEEFVFKEARLPAEYDTIGRAVITFTVNREGGLGNIKPIYFDHPAMAAVAVNMIKSTSDKWRPALKRNGSPTKATLEAVIPFCDNDTLFPSFLGGTYKNFTIYINKVIKYPIEAERKHISGRVEVDYIVDKHGYVTVTEIRNSGHESIDKELMRVMRNSPRWYPGVAGNETAGFKFRAPVIFRLD